jgi:hypothetical protein
MASITAFPLKRAVGPTRRDADPFKNGAGSRAELEIDEDSQRGRVNFFAAIALVLVIAAGWWLVNSFVEMQRVQGCYASGTRYCSSI